MQVPCSSSQGGPNDGKPNFASALGPAARHRSALRQPVLESSSTGQGPSPEEFRPKLDVVELDNEYKLCAELPGMHSEDVEVRLEEGMLTIQGEKRREEHRDHSRHGIRWSEATGASLARSGSRPGIDLGRIKAKFVQGVLIVTIPKGAGARMRARSRSPPKPGALEGEESTPSRRREARLRRRSLQRRSEHRDDARRDPRRGKARIRRPRAA